MSQEPCNRLWHRRRQRIAFEDVDIDPEIWGIWQTVTRGKALELRSQGFTTDDLRAIQEQLWLLDDDETLQMYSQIPRNEEEFTFDIPRDRWAWKPSVTGGGQLS